MGTFKDPIGILNRDPIERRTKEIWKNITRNTSRGDDEESAFWFEISNENFVEH
jgi:hypothetical protein